MGFLCCVFTDGQASSGLEALGQQQQQARVGQWGEPSPFLHAGVAPFPLAQQLAHLGQPGLRVPQQLLRAGWGLGPAAEEEPRPAMPRLEDSLSCSLYIILQVWRIQNSVGHKMP